MGPIDLFRLVTGKWVQLRGHHIDLQVGDTPVKGTVDLDLRIGDDLATDPKDTKR